MPDYRDADNRYLAKIAALHRELGIALDYLESSGLPLQQECRDLVEAGSDVFGRPLLMQSRTYQAWCEMRESAAEAGVKLEVVSGYRSASYQRDILLRKLQRGESLSAILKVNAAPGYSEHHSGRALDLGCAGCEHLTEAFEETRAFDWLCEHAGGFNFTMSFPRNNPYGLCYEPWHWKCSENENPAD